MRELLTDNASLLQLEAFNDQYPIPKPRLREVMSLPYGCIATWHMLSLAHQTHESGEMLVYARLIIHDTQWHGGEGRLDYDRDSGIRLHLTLHCNRMFCTQTPGGKPCGPIWSRKNYTYIRASLGTFYALLLQCLATWPFALLQEASYLYTVIVPPFQDPD